MLSLPAGARSQAVRGTVVDVIGSIGVPGVIVALTDTGGVDAARVLSNERGEFSIRASTPGRYHLRALRIGYQPTDSALGFLALNETREVRLPLSGEPIRLRAVRVVARSACAGRRSTDGDVLRLWEEARKALIATTLTRTQRSYEVRIATFERWLDSRGVPTNRQSFFEKVGKSTKPFTSVPATSLAIEGYVVRDTDGGIIYRAPDAEILASDGFAAAYCLHISGDSSSRPGVNADLLGLGFSPAERRPRNVADIRGVLWIDRETAELRALEYRYTGLPDYQADHARGRVEFRRLSDGAWLVDRWTIRMPIHRAPERRGQLPELAGYVVNGGAILRMQRGTAVVREGGVSLAGTVRDTRGAAVAGARVEVVGTNRAAISDSAGRFVFSMLIDGRHTVHLRTALLDSLGAPPVEAVIEVNPDRMPPPLDLVAPLAQMAVARACRDAKPEDDAGIGVVHGVVRRADGQPAAGASVRVTWQQQFRHVSEISYRAVSRDGVTNSDGSYRVCGVPRERELRFDARGAGALGSTLPIARRLEGNALLLKHDFVLP